ncbi:hypothetical protein BTUL_0048g00060 [Botrytis tulipae]|uniref:Uncharacterized protein n=1 Tax=Botrytis tulipae TaxID=87230 RepID=A0A4Z1EUW5_9HELO|nr:hypothetical protein BTUL_0048g00060 [Botrytis tulipae]
MSVTIGEKALGWTQNISNKWIIFRSGGNAPPRAVAGVSVVICIIASSTVLLKESWSSDYPFLIKAGIEFVPRKGSYWSEASLFLLRKASKLRGRDDVEALIPDEEQFSKDSRLISDSVKDSGWAF